MPRSLTATVPMQRNITTKVHLDMEQGYKQKQLTLWLESPEQQHPPARRNRMANPTYQAPIARLPVELLSYIFILGAHTPDADEDGIFDYLEGPSSGNESVRDGKDDISPCLSSSSTPPDIFAAVNRHWRDVALGTPQLWTRICITIGDLMNGEDDEWFPAVIRYIARSGRCPLDVYIDARDPDWDFSENDSIGAVVSPNFDETYDYTHPFKVEHMHYVLNLLLPHIARMRSLAILTDRWAPMDTALQCLSFQRPDFVSSPRPLPSSLPLLESLVLMRCNEFVSYNPHFSPVDRKDSAHLPFGGLLRTTGTSPKENALLPRLRQVVLSGVHLDWSSLPLIFPTPRSSDTPGLQHLELSYHSPDVRPSEQECRRILQATPALRSLSIRVSGPRSPASFGSCGSPSAAPPIALPRLNSLELCYDDVFSAAMLLDSIDVAEVQHVVFEDSSSPVHDETLDAEPLLLACAGTPGSPRHGQPLFPRAQYVTLRRVDASAEAFQAFYDALHNLRQLTVAHMFMWGGAALSSRDVQLTFVPPEVPMAGAPGAETYSTYSESLREKTGTATGPRPDHSMRASFAVSCPHAIPVERCGKAGVS